MMQITKTTVPVQFDDINTLFDSKTRPPSTRTWSGSATRWRRAARRSTTRSRASRRCSATCGPSPTILADPNTQLTRFFVALNRFFGTISPVAQVERAAIRGSGDDLRGDLAQPPDLANTIKESPPTLDVSTQSLQAQQPLLVDLTTFDRDLAARDRAAEVGAARTSIPRSPPASRCCRALRARTRSSRACWAR